DRATIAWADDILVLALRTGGNLHTLLRARLQKAGAHVLLADVPGLQSSRARTDLLELGAENWQVPLSSPISNVRELPPLSETTPAARSPILQHGIIPCPPAECWEYLIHTTRACTGPWPEQSQTDYFDSLLDARPDADHSAFGTLLRIVR